MSLVIVLPAPIIDPLPICKGAIKAELEPIKTSSSIIVLCFLKPS
jgi:hypothetical protein